LAIGDGRAELVGRFQRMGLGASSRYRIDDLDSFDGQERPVMRRYLPDTREFHRCQYRAVTASQTLARVSRHHAERKVRDVAVQVEESERREVEDGTGQLDEFLFWEGTSGNEPLEKRRVVHGIPSRIALLIVFISCSGSRESNQYIQ
jgi:hypothetical protein